MSKVANISSHKFKNISKHKTWLEIDSAAAKHNYRTIRKILNSKTKLWAVVKSNAYGHGLLAFSQLADRLGVDGFCVDSVTEGLKLREAGIKKFILVLGPTLFPELFKKAAERGITVTISSLGSLQMLKQNRSRPNFHLKIDTGMRRQGFYPEELPKVLRNVKSQMSNVKELLTGVYTHFASAKDVNYPTFTERQFAEFQKAIGILRRAGYKNIVRHCSATGAAMINPKYHLDAARIGIGLYGLWPSRELEIQLSDKILLKPILNWHSLISEIKNVKSGDYIGYDLTERMSKNAKIAVIPIGYWHGFDRGLSGIGNALICGRRCRVLGRVSMDIIVADVSGLPAAVGDKATLIGRQGKEEITAAEIAAKLNTTGYEIVTRINPLIWRFTSRTVN
jgi:alanine racemase